MLSLKKVRQRQRKAAKLMRQPANKEALKKGLERLKRVYSLKLVGAKKVLVSTAKAGSRKRKTAKPKGAGRSR